MPLAAAVAAREEKSIQLAQGALAASAVVGPAVPQAAMAGEALVVVLSVTLEPGTTKTPYKVPDWPPASQALA
jgi:hypothetical protein